MIPLAKVNKPKKASGISTNFLKRRNVSIFQVK